MRFAAAASDRTQTRELGQQGRVALDDLVDRNEPNGVGLDDGEPAINPASHRTCAGLSAGQARRPLPLRRLDI